MHNLACSFKFLESDKFSNRLLHKAKIIMSIRSIKYCRLPLPNTTKKKREKIKSALQTKIDTQFRVLY